MELTNLSATDCVALLSDRKITSEELVRAHSYRTRQVNPSINAVVTINDEQVLRECAVAEGPDPGQRRTIEGLPLTIKDSFEVAGWRTTSGSELYREHIPQTNAVLVSRVRAHGGVVMGRTNVPELCADLITDNAIFGRTNNPHDISRTPGGSSGGAAAAVAAGLSPVEIGSDFGGSIRLPAAYCGIFGHRCTQLWAPLRGQIPGAPGELRSVAMAAGGFFARCADDLRLMLRIVGGPDNDVLRLPHMRLSPPPWRKLRLGVFAYPEWAPIDKRIASRISTALHSVDSALELIEIVLPFSVEELRAPFMSVLFAQTGASYSEHDYEQLRSDSFLDTLGFTPTFRAYTQLEETVLRLRLQFFDACRHVDAVALPAAPSVAPVHQSGGILERSIELDGQPVAASTQFDWLALASVFDLPATVAPIGFEYGMPVGIQIVAAPFCDEWTIEIAETFFNSCSFDASQLTRANQFARRL